MAKFIQRYLDGALYPMEEDDGGSTGGDSGSGDDGDAKDKTGDGGKTFSQEEVNSLLAKNKRNLKKNILAEMGIDDQDGAKNTLEEMRKWKESQMSKEEKLTADLQGVSSKLEEANGRASVAEAKVELLLAGVDKDKLPRAVKLIGTYDEGTSAEQAAALLVDFPELKGKAAGQAPPNVGGGSGGSTPDAREAALSEMRKNMRIG
ncbi:MAG: hypothetical protein PQJ60_10720 [Spirochaetales bacterium]|nr:hypothetical protein [Spirochaetales bacterium]